MSAGFYDLNIPWPAVFAVAAGGASSDVKGKGKEKAREDIPPPEHSLDAADKARLSALVDELAELGYRTTAFNHVIHSRFEPALHRNPFARTDAQGTLTSHPPFPQRDPRHGTARPSVRQLSRMTLVLDERSFTKAGHGLTNNAAASLLTYDLLAVRPLTEVAFSAACTTLTELKPLSIDIISLDLASAPRLPFILRRSTLRAAIANGAVFEVCYADALRSGSEAQHARARSNLMSNTRELLRVTNGRGILLSSGAKDLLGLRGPHDVINLAAVLGMTPSAARDALSATAASLLARAATRKSYRGIVGTPQVVHASASAPKEAAVAGACTTPAPAPADARKRDRGEGPDEDADTAAPPAPDPKKRKIANGNADSAGGAEVSAPPAPPPQTHDGQRKKKRKRKSGGGE